MAVVRAVVVVVPGSAETVEVWVKVSRMVVMDGIWVEPRRQMHALERRAESDEHAERASDVTLRWKSVTVGGTGRVVVERAVEVIVEMTSLGVNVDSTMVVAVRVVVTALSERTE